MDSDSIVTQATSAPLYGEDLSDLIPAFCDYDGLFMDMVYGQPSGIFSFLLSEGKVACDGLPMLIEQALASQRLWWGRSDSYDRVLGILSDDRK
jgi:shikimate 5-dehydrogenase